MVARNDVAFSENNLPIAFVEFLHCQGYYSRGRAHSDNIQLIFNIERCAILKIVGAKSSTQLERFV